MMEKDEKWLNGSRRMEKQLQNDEVRFLSTCKSTQALCKGRLPAVNYYHKELHLGCCSSPRFASGVYKSSSWLSESGEKVGHYSLLFEGSRLDEHDS